MNHMIRFNPRISYLLIRNAILLNLSAILITSATVGVIIFLLSFIDAKLFAAPMFYKRYYFFCLYAIGIIIAGKMFKDLHDEVKSASWLTLPAATFEKFSICVVLSTVVFACGVMILIFLVSLLSEGFNRIYIGSCHALFNPFDKQIILRTAQFIVIQSPFLLGAIYFKKHALSKTVLSIVIYLSVLYAIAYIIIKIDIYNWDNIMQHPIWPVIKYMALTFWYFLAPIFWVIGYFRLKEAEA